MNLKLPRQIDKPPSLRPLSIHPAQNIDQHRILHRCVLRLFVDDIAGELDEEQGDGVGVSDQVDGVVYELLSHFLIAVGQDLLRYG